MMEVMAAHNITHESLNSVTQPHSDAAPLHCHDNTTIVPDNRLHITSDKVHEAAARVEQAARGDQRTSSSESNTSIGCQTALSYARQDTLVPLTALLQLVNNSILTVMENIEKVLLVNSSDENIFSADSINSFWNAANASASTSPSHSGQERISPSINRMVDTEMLDNDPSSDESNLADKLMRPIVIQDRFQNSLEIPTDNGEAEQPPEKRFCPDNGGVKTPTPAGLNLQPSPSSNFPTSRQAQSPSTPTSAYPGLTNTTNSLSPTVNVAGSLTKYICPYCYKVFNWKTNMNRHISVTHLMKPKPTIKVPIMRKSKPYTCPICGNTFAWRSNMNRHILHLHKIDHKQLNKLLLSAYLPDLRNSDTTPTSNPATTPDNSTTFSSLSSLTMLPQQNNFNKNVSPSPPPPSTGSFTPTSNTGSGTSTAGYTPTTGTAGPADISFLYRNHKALLDSVKKEQVPLHVKEAALTSFYQSHKSLFDTAGPNLPPSTAGYKPDPQDRASPKSLSPGPNSNINNLSALYQAQKALLEQQQQQQQAAAAAAAARHSKPATSGSATGQDLPLSSLYQNHRAMLDTVSLLTNLGGMNINNLANGGSTDVDVTNQGIKIESNNQS